MAGLSRVTGRPISNIESAIQGVAVILTTSLGTRVMRREFGGGIGAILGRLMTPILFSVYRAVLVAAIETWEPRFRVLRIDFDATTDEVRLGSLGFLLTMEWRPRGHLGDFTIAGTYQAGMLQSGTVFTANGLTLKG